jgi:mRNA-degrading endonuclease RelE of RelBE toxin-antitoxin system
MYKYIFTRNSKKQFLKLSEQIQTRILNKLKYFKNIEIANKYIRNVYHLEPATHRLKIWNYRLLITFNDKNVIIYKIAHRKEIYK